MFSKEDAEKRVERLEKKLEEKIELDNKIFEQMNVSFTTFYDILKNLKDENEKLKADNEFLIKKHQELLKQPIRIEKGKLTQEVKQTFVVPVTDKVKEKINDNAELIKKITTEGTKKEEIPRQIQPKPGGLMDKMKKKMNPKEKIETEIKVVEKQKEQPKEEIVATPIDELFVMVMNGGIVKFSDAATKFKVHELQIEEWAKILEDHGLVEIHYPPVGKPEIRKIGLKKETKPMHQ